MYTRLLFRRREYTCTNACIYVYTVRWCLAIFLHYTSRGPSVPVRHSECLIKKKKKCKSGEGVGRNSKVRVDLHCRCPMIQTRFFLFFFIFYILLRDSSTAVQPCTRTIEFLPIESRQSPLRRRRF